MDFHGRVLTDYYQELIDLIDDEYLRSYPEERPFYQKLVKASYQTYCSSPAFLAESPKTRYGLHTTADLIEKYNGKLLA